MPLVTEIRSPWIAEGKDTTSLRDEMRNQGYVQDNKDLNEESYVHADLGGSESRLCPR